MLRAVLNANDPLPWPMSNLTPRARLAHHVLHPALMIVRRVRERAECMREYIARPQHLHHLLVRRRREVDVTHQRHAELVRSLQRDRERRRAVNAGRAAPDAHFDTDDDVAVLVRDLHRLDRGHQPHLLALSDHHGLGECVDPGKRDVQISKNAHRGRLDHVLAEASEIARPCATGVDRRRDARGAAEILRVDAERRAAPIDMRVQIDQAGRNDVALHVANFCRGADIVADLRDLAALKGDISHAINVLRRVDDAPALQDEVKCHLLSPSFRGRPQAGARNP
jgi:hypothetical protein